MPEEQYNQDRKSTPPMGSAYPSTSDINHRQKAAIVVSLLLQNGADMPLSRLPSDLQTDLTHQMAQLRLVDQKTLKCVIDEFTQELDAIGLSTIGGLENTLTLLEGKISKSTIQQLCKDAGVQLVVNPWARIKALKTSELLPFIQKESVEVSAVLISKLDVQKAAEILAQLPGEQARSISYAISMTDNITPASSERIGQSLIAQMENRPERVFEKPPAERIGMILTVTSQQIRDEVLSGLGKTNPALAEMVRKSMFIFEDISKRLSAKDIPQIIKSIEHEDVVKALAYANAHNSSDTVDFIISSLPKRLSETLLEDINNLSKIEPRDGEQATAKLIGSLQKMLANGEITLQ